MNPMNWYRICGRCTLFCVSFGLLGWGTLAFSPTQGHQAGSPTIIQKMMARPELQSYVQKIKHEPPKPTEEEHKSKD